MLYGKDATGLQSMATVLIVTEFNPVFMETRPYDCLSHTVFLRNLDHAHGLIKIVKFLRGRVKVPTSAALTALDSELDETLSNRLGTNPIHGRNTRCGMVPI
jgi:hypothetical protein